MNSKVNEAFRSWLINSYSLQTRSAGDVISRRNKLLTIVANPMEMTMEQVKQALDDEFSKGEFTKATLRSMVRSEKLFRQFCRSVQ